MLNSGAECADRAAETNRLPFAMSVVEVITPSMTFENGAIHALGESEVIGINDEAPHWRQFIR